MTSPDTAHVATRSSDTSTRPGLIGLYALIDTYETELIARAAESRRALPPLRARLDRYIATHRLDATPLARDLAARDWAETHTPDLLRAWQQRVVAAGGDHDAAAHVMSLIQSARRWAPLLIGLDPRLSDAVDLPPLARALDRAAEAGYQPATRLPQLLAHDPLPDQHPGRELHLRLLLDCPAALPPAPLDQARSMPADPAAGRPPPRGYRIDPIGDGTTYLVTTATDRVVGVAATSNQAVALADQQTARMNRARATPIPRYARPRPTAAPRRAR